MSKAARSLDVVRQAGKLLDYQIYVCSRANAYDLFRLEYCAPVWKLSAESHLDLMIVLFVVRKGCMRMNFDVWGHRRQISILCFL